MVFTWLFHVWLAFGMEKERWFRIRAAGWTDFSAVVDVEELEILGAWARSIVKSSREASHRPKRRKWKKKRRNMGSGAVWVVLDPRRALKR